MDFDGYDLSKLLTSVNQGNGFQLGIGPEAGGAVFVSRWIRSWGRGSGRESTCWGEWV